MPTPESHTKNLIRNLLLQYKIYPAKDAGAFPDDAEGWYFMPGQSGYGVSGIPDYILFYRGRGAGIEAKAPKKKPTGFQEKQIQAIRQSGAACFVVDGVEGLKAVEEWLNEQPN